METDPKLKVLYLPRWYPNRYDPMPGLFIERHARSVAGRASVAVLYVHQDERLKDNKFEIERFHDDEIFQIKIYYRPCSFQLGMISSLVNLLRFACWHRKGLRMVRKEAGKPDLIHVNVMTRLGVIALIYKWLTGTPYVITEHWTRYLPYMDNYRGWFRKAASRLVARNAAAIMPVTENLRKAMESHGLRNKNYRVIPNVVDLEMFKISEFEPAGKKPFIHVSCFEDKQKNISGILRALKVLSEERNDWICHMVGEGIHHEKLTAYARELGIDGTFVVFHGLKENNELARMMANALFQVMFSRFENLPVVILESYACGVPVLSTDVGGIREHMAPELGMLIPSEDETQLLEKIRYFLNHYHEFNREKLRDYARDHFSREVIGKQIAEVYKCSAKS